MFVQVYFWLSVLSSVVVFVIAVRAAYFRPSKWEWVILAVLAVGGAFLEMFDRFA
ncbi:MAG: hypothetical protein KGL46_09825 [Hyphomicrobiales bacterium]|nr:hypothetical protein [Hyphomicrobiales bacterium]